MKTKAILCLLLSLNFYYLASQVPQGFNYQAIARDGSGAIISNQVLPVKIAIQTLSTGGTTIWEEQHSVTSNQFGMISLVVGTGTRLNGTVATFSAIDWNAQTLYLKTTIQYPGTTWTTMGTTQIWSVPYSMVAKDVEGPINKLGINGTTSSLDEALFEVKNKDGQTIFAVYNEGVRVYVADGKGAKGGFAVGGFGTGKTESQKYLYVDADSIRAYVYDDPAVKGAKGGFAVGGFNLLKNRTNDYMVVSPDSIRMYIDDNGKGAKGGFAVGGFNTGKGEGAHYMDVATDANGITNPSENRVLWYPLKNAFLTGKVLIQKPDSVGENSFASGYESKAVGDWSQALGYQAIARGDYSTAIGKNAVANNANSFAFGDSARATNDEGYAIGRGAVASGYRSFAFGSAGVDSLGDVTDVTRALGDYSFAIGQGSQSTGFGSFSLGLADTASGDYSLAMGYGARATEDGSTAFGASTLASGYESIAMGRLTKASGYNSTAMGNETIASGFGATAMGSGTLASGSGSTAMGIYSMAIGGGSFAIGKNTTANALLSFALGTYTTALSPFETVIGINNTTYTPSGKLWSPLDRLFVVGNGTVSDKTYPITPSNALTILKNGYTGIGTSTPKYNLDVAGEIASSNPNAFRMRYGVYGTIFRQDEEEMYLLITNAGDKDGNWNDLRPFRINLSTGNLFFAGNVMAIQHGGNVGIGTSTPNSKLEVLTSGTDGYAGIGINSSLTGAKMITLNQGTAGKLNFTVPGVVDLVTFDFVNSRVGIGTTSPGYKLTINGTAWCSAGAWTGSDIRWKKNISLLDKTLKGILSLQSVSYELRTDEFPEMGFEPGRQIGLIAQDVEKVFPQLVKTDNNGYKAVAYDKLSAVLVEAIKEQQKEIDELKTLVNSLIADKTAR